MTCVREKLITCLKAVGFLVYDYVVIGAAMWVLIVLADVLVWLFTGEHIAYLT